ncbi:Fc.00g086750.m01.CDS01 [Cosmosporella sp. VM-42]
MATLSRVTIIGAGPAGLAAALALSQQSSPHAPIQVTILEVRDAVQTLGGAVNLTPLALRYLETLGVAQRIRAQASKVNGIDIVAYRTGGLLGTLWEGLDAVRVQRQTLVEAMMETVQALPKGQVDVVFGVEIQEIEELSLPHADGTIRVTFTQPGSLARVLEGDVLLGCDGLHSIVRSTLIDPDRKKTFSGKCNAYGYADISKQDASAGQRADGSPLINDTTLVSRGNDAMLLTYFNPSRDKLYLAAVMPRAEPKDGGREGWAVEGADKAGLKKTIQGVFASGADGGKLKGLGDIVEKCDEWFFFPVYVLPPGGIWAKGRALLLGDAAHAMPPQGESTGVAIEDGVLFAHVFSRRATRSVPRMLADYEKLRRADIDKTYRETMKRWNGPIPAMWSSDVAVEWITWAYLKVTGWNQDPFSRDVRKLALPS